MEYSPKKMTEELNKENFNFKKKFGQNFIVDKNIIHSIISKSNIDKDTLVIEIGPGAGSLTTELDKVSGHVLAYEIDKTLKPILEKHNLNNTTIIYEDFLKRNVEEVLKRHNLDLTVRAEALPIEIFAEIANNLNQEM